MRIASEFGFTLASRSRITALPSQPTLFDRLGDEQRKGELGHRRRLIGKTNKCSGKFDLPYQSARPTIDMLRRAEVAMRFKTIMASVALLTAPLWTAWSQAEGKTFRYGLEAPRSISNVILLLTIDRMRAGGYRIDITDFSSPETMSLALQNGDIDFVSTSAGTVFSAIDAGFDAKAFMGSAAADFQMVARKEFTTCRSLDGRRVAIQSRESTTGALTQNWLTTACPDARPNILVVPGSENRVAGLIAGQLDAAPIDMQNAAQLMVMRPGQFDIISGFSESTNLVGSLYYASTKWLENNKQTVNDFVSTYVTVLKEAKQDNRAAKAKLYEILPNADKAVLDRVMEGWLGQDIFIPIDGVQPEAVDFAIKFYGKVRPYRRIKDAADVSTTAYLPVAQ